MSIKSKIAAAYTGHLLAWLGILLLLAGLLFCAWGIYLLLAGTALGPAYAALVVGSGLISIILLLGLILALSQRTSKPSKAQQLREHPDTMLEQQIRPVLGDRATDWAKQNTGIAVVGALSAGVLIAASPELRKLIYSSARPVVARKAFQALQGLSDDD